MAHYVSGTPGALVLSHAAGYGTGLFRRLTSWYRIAKGEPVPLLTYPLDFYVVGWELPFDRKLTTNVLSMPSNLRDREELKLSFTIEYSMGRQSENSAEAIHLFTSEHRLSLDWDDAGGTFVPRTAEDDLALQPSRFLLQRTSTMAYLHETKRSPARGEHLPGFFIPRMRADEELTPEQIERQLTTTLTGPMNVTRAVLPVMRKQRSGHIISIRRPGCAPNSFVLHGQPTRDCLLKKS